MKAIWNNKVVAESNQTIIVEGNHYFPKDSVKNEFLTESDTKPLCPWKGIASYYSLDVDGAKNSDAAWYYPSTKEAAKTIEGYIAFWRGVKIID